MAAKPIVGRYRSTRQVTKRATRGFRDGMSNARQLVLHVPGLDETSTGDRDIGRVHIDPDAAGTFQFGSDQCRSCSHERVHDNGVVVAMQPNAPARQSHGKCTWMMELRGLA